MSLIPLEDARRYVLDRCPRLPAGVRPVADAVGLVLAEPVRSTETLPPFANSAVDGFAVRAADTATAAAGSPARLTVVDTVLAGRAPEVPVGPAQAIRIMTGAPMPPSADAVVMVEHTSIEPVSAEPGDAGGAAERVLVERAATPGDHVRGAGEDLRPGEVALVAGTPIGPAQVGVLASLAVGEITVVRRLRVGVLSTGDELVADGSPLRPGQIRDSNRPALLVAVAATGAETVDLGRIPDDEAAIEAAVRAGVASCDAVVSSGGVSMGDVDLVKVVLDRMGAMAWMQIAIKPAKPFAFGLVDVGDGRAVPVFGLPGNPVSSLVSFELLARPAFCQMQGHPHLDRPRVTATAAGAFPRRADGKTHFVRVTCEPAAGDASGYVARPAGGQGSHQLAALAAANGLAVLPDGDGVPAGGTIEVLLLPD